jgi:hypothetical protein
MSLKYVAVGGVLIVLIVLILWATTDLFRSPKTVEKSIKFPKTIEKSIKFPQRIYFNDTLKNNKYKLTILGDTINAFKYPGLPWSVKATGDIYYLSVEENGKLVARDSDDKMVWSPTLVLGVTEWVPGSSLSMQLDGNLVLYSPDHKPVWASSYPIA